MGFKVKDYYYQKAKKENFYARSVYKLEEIDAKYKLIKKKSRILDLGYYPGSWIQYCAGKIGEQGLITGVDIQPINEKISLLSNVELFQMSIEDIAGPETLGQNQPYSVLLSDMAPKTTGIKAVDQIGSLNLVEMIFEKLPLLLRVGGNLVVKVFDSAEAQQYLRAQKKRFSAFDYLKPQSTRSVSKEFFVIARGFKA